MGKLLRKLVNGIVPSWLSKIKSSADASPKKLLPSFRGGTHASSHKSSATSPSSTTNNTGVLVLMGSDDQGEQSGDGEEEPCGENIGISESPSLIKEGRTTSMKQAADKNGNKRHQEDHNDPHHPHLVDVKGYGNQDMRKHDTQNSARPADPSSRKQEIVTIDKYNDEYDHRPQQQHGNHKDHEHQHLVEFQGNHANSKSEKLWQCMQKDANNDHHQEIRSSCHIAHHVEPREFCRKEFLEFEREYQCLQEENNLHNHIHQKENDHGAHNGSDYHNNGHHDLLGFKRKSQYLKEKDGGEEEEEEEEEDGSSTTSSSMTGWGWKRRKGEKGVMSCDLPESICCIVGNSKAVVKHSQDPHLVLWESMVEMIVGNGLWELGSLEFLLFCYLSLNEPHLHPIIQSSFLKVLKDLERTS